MAEILVRCFEAPEGTHVFNANDETSTVEEVITMIDEIVPENRRGLINCDGPNLPIPGALDYSALAAAI